MVQRLYSFADRLVTHALDRLGLGVVTEDYVAEVRAALNAHAEMLDMATDRIVNLEARVSEFDLGAREAA